MADKVTDLIESGYGKEEKMHCAEQILSAGNKVHNLGLEEADITLASGFGVGMRVESVCGALTGAVMVLGKLVVEKNAHYSPKIKDLTEKFLQEYESEMGSIYCCVLKKTKRTKDKSCDPIIYKAAKVLEEIIAEEGY